MQTHINQYRISLSRDAYAALAESAESVKVEGRSAKEWLSEAVEGVVGAIQKADEASYWTAIERHQALLFRLHRLVADQSLASDTRDPFVVFDFIHAHGWRRFRFSERIIHFLRRDGEDEILISVLPNYRRENIERLQDFLHAERQQAVFDAAEMEALLRPGREEHVLPILREKVLAKEQFRFLPPDQWGGSEFINLPLKKANSAFHVTDWTLPLRG